ncbi:MAG: HNH endonuclease [Rhodomicrobium sp.]
MQVIDQDTGNKVILDSTPELTADLAPLNQVCSHSRKELRQKRNRGGALQYISQCLDCGRAVGLFLKHSPELEKVPTWDDQIEDDYHANRERRRKAILQKHVRIQRTRSEGFWREYNAYLESKEWREKRERVLKRENGQCEGCGIKPATQVHHRTYAHVFNEFLFELVAVCDDCHEQLHLDDSEHKGPARPCDGCRYESEENGKPWCFRSDVSTEEALSADGDCGPNASLFEPLR